MTCFETVMAIINIAAVIVAPIIAVKVGQTLQDRAQNRKDKMQIFNVLMTSRLYIWTTESVHAYNQIDIVFADDDNVRQAWKNLLDAYSTTEISDFTAKKRQDLKCKLLEEMAKDLGYKDKITWETIQNPYIPKGMTDAIQQQQTIQAGQEKLACAVDMFLQIIATNAQAQNQSIQGDKPDANT